MLSDFYFIGNMGKQFGGKTSADTAFYSLCCGEERYTKLRRFYSAAKIA